MRHILCILILFPIVAFAQGNPNMPPNMPMDMEQMQKAMACMKNLDRSSFEGLEREGKKMEADVGALCRSGKRDEAQDKAMAYGKEIMNRPEMKKMRECSKMMAGMMPKMPFENLEEESKNRHICDEFKPGD
jgi:hypothetical protein